MSGADAPPNFTISNEYVLDFVTCGAPGKPPCYLQIVNARGETAVRINMDTGQVVLSHPDKMDDAAREFWRAVQKLYPGRCPK